ncbi:hypothetical protein [Bradyrhizobium oligotrophicum]|uniref:hypothetical protein n=1 Tax=Bradyrhizobium oligotrophicum TaxID=44255 RepID=UPI003EBE2D6A
MSETPISNGIKYTLVLASLTKRILQQDLPPQMRLEFLQHLAKMEDPSPAPMGITADTIARIEPMDDRGQELLCEIMKLDQGKPVNQRGRSLDVIAEKFDVFAGLNPSLRAT